MSVVCVVT